MIPMHAWACAGLLAVFAAPTQATELNQVVLEKSAVTYVSTQMGVAVEGDFKRFRGQLRFDPAKPQAARAVIELDLASIDVGSREAHAEVTGPNWFHTAKYPLARFESTAFRALGNNRYEARGTLSLRGRQRDVVVPFSVKPQGNRGVIDGAFVLKRLDYGIGQGEWGDTGIVADEVKVRFRFLAESSPAARSTKP